MSTGLAAAGAGMSKHLQTIFVGPLIRFFRKFKNPVHQRPDPGLDLDFRTKAVYPLQAGSIQRIENCGYFGKIIYVFKTAA